MRKASRWMQHLDERMLEYLSGRLWSTPDLMALYVDATPKRIAERCEVLARVDLVVPSCDHRSPEEATMWELGYWGERYLAGDVDAELIWPAPAPRPPEAVRPAWWAEFG